MPQRNNTPREIIVVKNFSYLLFSVIPNHFDNGYLQVIIHKLAITGFLVDPLCLK